MTTTHKPATPLPWKVYETATHFEIGSVDLNGEGDYSGEGYTASDAAYIAHAANAYPRLVEALRRCVDADRDDYDATSAADALLRELGEAE